MEPDQETHVSASTFSALMGAKATIHDATVKRRLRKSLQRPAQERDLKELITMLTCFAPKLIEAFQHANVEEVVRSMLWKEYEYDDVIFWQGDEADGLYYILSGSVSVHKKNHNRPNKKLVRTPVADDEDAESLDRIMTFGDFIVELREEKFFGELAFAHSEVAPRRQATVVAGYDDGGLTKEMLGKERKVICVVVPPQAHAIGQDSALDEIRQKLSFLRECLFFSHWPLSQHYVLAHTMQRQYLDAGQTLSRTGNRKGMIACIWAGEVRVVLPVEMSIAVNRRPKYDGHRPPIGLPPKQPTSKCINFIECALLGAGEVWGFRDVLEDDEERCQLIATKETQIFFILYDNMKNIIVEDPKIRDMIYILGARRRKWEWLREQYARKMAKHNAQDVSMAAQTMDMARYLIRAENMMGKDEFKQYEAVGRNCETIMKEGRAAHELATGYLACKDYTKAIKMFSTVIEKCEIALVKSDGIKHPCIVDAEQYIRQAKSALSTSKTFRFRQAVAAKIMAKRIKRWCQKRVLMRKAGALPDVKKQKQRATKQSPRRWRREAFEKLILDIDSLDSEREEHSKTASARLSIFLGDASLHGAASVFGEESLLTDGSRTMLSEERQQKPLTAQEVNVMTKQFLSSHDLDFDEDGSLMSTIVTPKKPSKPRERPWRQRHNAIKGQILGGQVK